MEKMNSRLIHSIWLIDEWFQSTYDVMNQTFMTENRKFWEVLLSSINPQDDNMNMFEGSETTEGASVSGSTYVGSVRWAVNKNTIKRCKIAGITELKHSKRCWIANLFSTYRDWFIHHSL